MCAFLNAAPRGLRLIDAVSCVGVTHASVAHAIALGADAQLIHRLPAWFARRWRCVRHRRIPVNEAHAYMPNGSFSFERATQAAGTVLSFRAAPPPPAPEPDAAANPDAPPPPPPPPPPMYFELVARYDDEEALAAVGLPQWRPGVCVAPMGSREMRTAQRVALGDMSCPDRFPEVDEPGICTGRWRADDGEDDVEGAPAAAEDL